ncbi:hypothetical protein Tco_1169566 [Tanacetum coccineum]
MMNQSVRPLPSHRLALRYTSHHLDNFTFESSSHSSSGHSISGHSLSRHTPLDTTDADLSTPQRFVHPLLTRTPWCSEAYLHIDMEVDVGDDVEDEVEDEVNSSDIPDAMLMPDVVESLEQEQHVTLRHHDDGESESRQNMTITCSGMTPEAIEELVNRRVEEALAAYEVTRAANAFKAENQSQNGSDVDNGNGGDGNGGNGIGGNGNPNENNRDVRPVARECTYQDFMKRQPLNFKGTEGVVGLIKWFEKMEIVFHISNCPEKYQVEELMKLMAEMYCPRNEIQMMESELWNLTVKNNDLAAYTQIFQELTMM